MRSRGPFVGTVLSLLLAAALKVSNFHSNALAIGFLVDGHRLLPGPAMAAE
jgi:hypothetical protein